MSVPIDDVAAWWVTRGVGHVILSECTCGLCPDRWQALCGLAGNRGEKTAAVPPVICPRCRLLIDSPYIRPRRR